MFSNLIGTKLFVLKILFNLMFNIPALAQPVKNYYLAPKHKLEKFFSILLTV